MQIGNTVLTEDCKGSKVTYVPMHAKDDSSQWEGGTIASWNDTYVFVNHSQVLNAVLGWTLVVIAIYFILWRTDEV